VNQNVLFDVADFISFRSSHRFPVRFASYISRRVTETHRRRAVIRHIGSRQTYFVISRSGGHTRTRILHITVCGDVALFSHATRVNRHSDILNILRARRNTKNATKYEKKTYLRIFKPVLSRFEIGFLQRCIDTISRGFFLLNL